MRRLRFNCGCHWGVCVRACLFLLCFPSLSPFNRALFLPSISLPISYPPRAHSIQPQRFHPVSQNHPNCLSSLVYVPTFTPPPYLPTSFSSRTLHLPRSLEDAYHSLALPVLTFASFPLSSCPFCLRFSFALFILHRSKPSYLDLFLLVVPQLRTL